MNEIAISIINEYINDCYFEPKQNWPEYEFRRRSISRWAADEILNRIRETPESHNAVDIIEDFIDEMDNFIDLSDDRERSFIFQVAKEAAEDIGILFV